MMTQTLYVGRDAQSTPRLVFLYRCTKDANVDPAEVAKNGVFSRHLVSKNPLQLFFHTEAGEEQPV